MLGWLVALVIVMCDGMVWSELGAAMPGSGGSFGYLRHGYGAEKVGRLMGFLFVWQFVLSGPLEIASGYIGFSQYLGYIWKGITARQTMLVVTVIGLLNIALLYRRITSIAKITLTLWIGTILTVIVVIVTGALHFDYRVAFDFPPGAFNFSIGFLLGLGAASRIGSMDRGSLPCSRRSSCGPRSAPCSRCCWGILASPTRPHATATSLACSHACIRRKVSPLSRWSCWASSRSSLASCPSAP